MKTYSPAHGHRRHGADGAGAVVGLIAYPLPQPAWVMVEANSFQSRIGGYLD